MNSLYQTLINYGIKRRHFQNRREISYNSSDFLLDQEETIKNQDILSVISEISETLSLTSRPEQLLETTLDTLATILDVDCCWVQLAQPGSHQLTMAASRGFTAEMRGEMSSLDREHPFIREIVGMGQKIVIPDLSKDGQYAIPVFEKSGFGSLVAVPIMTYRVHGVLGTAHRAGRKFGRDYPELIAVIAKLIGMSLNKAILGSKRTDNQVPAEPDAVEQDSRETAPASAPATGSSTGPHRRRPPSQERFRDHTRRMRAFRDSHRSR